MRAALALLLLTAASAAAPSAPWAGRWRGLLFSDGGSEPVAVLLTANDGDAGGIIAVQLSVPDEMYAVEAVDAAPGALSVRASGLSVEGTLDGGAWSGSIHGRRAGRFSIEKLKDLSHAQLDALSGTYRAEGDGGRVDVLREYNYSVYVEESTGETGFLMPRSETSFFVGPSIGAHFPPVKELRFTLGEGRTASLSIRDVLTGRQLLARRTEPFVVEQIRFPSEDVTLAGELRIPPGPANRLPAVILLQGSNLQTRNGQGGWVGFMAQAFARHGFVTLTFDKRGIGGSSGPADDGKRVTDGLAALAFLRARQEVDPSQIGLFGISQGGSAIAGVAATAGGIAFLINVSGATVNSNEQEVERTEQVLKADGFSKSDIQRAVALQRLKFRYACERRGWDDYVAALRAAQGTRWLPDPYIGPPETKESTAWDFWKCGTNPGDSWSKLHAPAILLLFGEHEALCDPAKNIAAFEGFMLTARNRRHEVRRVLGAEHSMTEAASGGERAQLAAHRYIPSLFDDLPVWALKQLPASR